jgi:hypothetical protein
MKFRLIKPEDLNQVIKKVGFINIEPVYYKPIFFDLAAEGLNTVGVDDINETLSNKDGNDKNSHGAVEDKGSFFKRIWG